MISPILSAISPDTPVSTSSKIIVGKAVNPAIIALMQSINREISPPEAVWATGCALIGGEHKSDIVHSIALRLFARKDVHTETGIRHPQRNNHLDQLRGHRRGSDFTLLAKHGGLLKQLFIRGIQLTL